MELGRYGTPSQPTELTKKLLPAKRTQLPCEGTRYRVRPTKDARRDGRRADLPTLLLVAVLTEPLLPLVSGNLVALALTAAWHKSRGQGGKSGAGKGTHRQMILQMSARTLTRAFDTMVRLGCFV